MGTSQQGSTSRVEVGQTTKENGKKEQTTFTQGDPLVKNLLGVVAGEKLGHYTK